MTTITPEQHLTVVKHLAGGKPPAVVATITRVDEHEVSRIGASHGYPDRDKLGWAVDILTKNLEKAATDGLPEPSREVGQIVRPQAIHRADPPPAHAPAQPDEIRVLLNAAKSAKPKRIQALANRVFDDLDRLRAMLDVEREKTRAAEAETAQKRAARAEVDRLKKELAAAQAKLRGTPTPKPQTADDGVGEHECPGCDRTFTSSQGRALHQRRANCGVPEAS